MTVPEKAKDQSPVEASSPADDSTDGDSFETPMLAVWASLAAILVAGLYGLYLGTNAKSKSKSDTSATSSYSSPVERMMALGNSPGATGSMESRRHS